MASALKRECMPKLFAFLLRNLKRPIMVHPVVDLMLRKFA